METKEQKQYYLFVKGERVAVTEEVYRAYVRPISTAQKADARNAKCLVKGKNGKLIRCKEDCKKCKYYEAGNMMPGGILSLDGLADSGFESGADVDIESDMIAAEQSNEMSATLYEAIQKLNERQQYIIREIYFNGKKQSELAKELGIAKSSLSDALRRALASLKTFLEKN